jgi:hypothetical protein
MQLQIYGQGAQTPNLDSIKVGDSLVAEQFWSIMIWTSFADAHWMISWVETGDPSTYMYEHGDTALVRVWGEGRQSSCRIKLLEPPMAQAVITEPANLADSILVGDADTVYWNELDVVDYYAVLIAFNVRWNGVDQLRLHYGYTHDTSYVVTPAIIPDSTFRFGVYVTPFTGPDPQTGVSNWSGDYCNGRLYSFGSRHQTEIIVLPSPPVALPAMAPSAIPPEKITAAEIVAGVYEKFGR